MDTYSKCVFVCVRQSHEGAKTIRQDSQTFGVVLIMLGAILFGLTPTFATFAYADGASALMVMLGRSVFGLLTLIVFIYLTGRSTGHSIPNMRRAFVAGAAHAVATFGILASILYIDISLASIILFLYPFPIAIIAHFRGETRLGPVTIGLMLLATVGLALVLGVNWNSTDPRGIAIAIMGGAAFTVMVISMADLTKTVGAPRSNLLMTIWAVIIFTAISIGGPVTGLTDAPVPPATIAGWVWVVGVGVMFALGYLCFFISASIIGTARASLLSISEPVMIILFAVVLVGESLSFVQWIGVVIVFASLIMTEITRR